MLKLLICISIFLVSNLSFAKDLAGPVSGGMGNAGSAAVDAVESVYQNIAGITGLNHYYFGLSHFSRGLGNNSGWNEYGIVLTDASSGGAFPASAGYRYARFTLNSRPAVRTHWRVGAAHRTGNFSYGGTFHQSSTTSSESDFSEKENQVDLGLLWVLKDSLAVAMTAESILAENQDVPLFFRQRSELGFGVQYLFTKTLKLRWDIGYPINNNKEKRIIQQIGVESGLAHEFKFRLGLEVNDYEAQNYYSLGVGWEGPRLKLAYSFQQGLRGSGSGDTRHFIDLWFNI